MERTDIIDFATGSHEDRYHLNIEDARKQKAIMYSQVRELLETIFDLALLEGALVNDEYHQAKLSFKDFGEEYGYIHAYTERSVKTNVFRFQYRRPTETGKIIRKSMPMNRSKGGYTPSAFTRAGHDMEKDLCLDTEEKFLALRNESKAIRKVLRSLKAFEDMLSEDMSEE